ncbi:MAG: hypothetical protein ACYCVZ_04815 [Streptosporangiaceae bacterium]
MRSLATDRGHAVHVAISVMSVVLASDGVGGLALPLPFIAA